MSVLSVNRRKNRNKPPSRKPKKERLDPSDFEGLGPVRIEEAYSELSRNAFAVWMRLVVMEPDQLRGRYEIARLLGYSPGRSNQVLMELKRKGYISFITHGKPFKPTEIFIERRPLVEARGKFVRVN